MTISEKTMKEYLREYLQVKEECEKLEARKRALAEKFHEELGNGKNEFGPYVVTTWESVRPTVSGKALKEEMPEVFAKYGKDTIVPGIRVTRAQA